MTLGEAWRSLDRRSRWLVGSGVVASLSMIVYGLVGAAMTLWALWKATGL